MIYLASPYSHDNSAVREKRFQEASRSAALLMSERVNVFSPVSHTHPICEELNMPRGWDFWAEYDKWFVSRCDMLVVLMLDGWQESVGIRSEIELASRYGKRIVFLKPGYEEEFANAYKKDQAEKQ